MSYRSLLVQTATVTRSTPNGVDAEGNPAYTTATADYACRLQQVTATEENAGVVTARAGWLLFLPPEADIRADDQVTVSGDAFEVDGPPNEVFGASSLHHIEAQLRSVEA